MSYVFAVPSSITASRRASLTETLAPGGWSGRSRTAPPTLVPSGGVGLSATFASQQRQQRCGIEESSRLVSETFGREAMGRAWVLRTPKRAMTFRVTRWPSEVWQAVYMLPSMSRLPV